MAMRSDPVARAGGSGNAPLVVTTLCAGQAQPIASGKISAIAKRPVDGPVRITRLGLEGDTQADRRHHGGPDMAVHCYPLDHHVFWREQIGGHPLLEEPGCFGTNLALAGLTEGHVGVGARFRLGSALLEACQPRQPCSTIEQHFGRRGMVKAVVETGRCGWFFRVLEEGVAQAGDTLCPVEKSEPDWSMLRVFHAVYGTGKPSDAELRECAALPAIADHIRDRVRHKLAAL